MDSRFFLGKLEAMLVLPSRLVEKFDDKFTEGNSYFDEKFVDKFTEGTLEVWSSQGCDFYKFTSDCNFYIL